MEAMWNEHIRNENKNTLVNIFIWLLVSPDLEEGRVGSSKVLYVSGKACRYRPSNKPKASYVYNGINK